MAKRESKFSSHLLVMNTFFQVFILLLSNCADYLRAQSWMNMNISVGSTAVLPCNWKKTSITKWSNSLKIEWLTGSGVVLERSSILSCQGNMYVNRVSISEDKLRSGDCSLVLKDITHKDAGIYESSVVVQNTGPLGSESVPIQNVELIVNDVEDKNISAKPDGENPPVSPDPGKCVTVIAVVCSVCWVLIIIGVCVLYRKKVHRYRQDNAGNQEVNG